MKKVITACVCVLVLLGLAACRTVAEQPFHPGSFVHGSALIREHTAWHVVMDIRREVLSFEQVIQFYEEAIFFLHAQETERVTRNDLWIFAGTYGEDNHTLRIEINGAGDEFTNIMVTFTDETLIPLDPTTTDAS